MRGRRRYDLRVIGPLERTAGKRLGAKLPTHQVGPPTSVAAPVKVRLRSLEGRSFDCCLISFTSTAQEAGRGPS